MRAGVVLTTIALGLALGIIAGLSESHLLTRGLIIGFAPAIWAASHVVARLTRRDIWHFTAPYEYLSTRGRGKAASTARSDLGERFDSMAETDDRSTLSLAA
jgi:hypothetical protein